MIRIILAALLLRTGGCRVEYRVQRRTIGDDGLYAATDGTTLLRTDSFSEAKAKLDKVRVGDGQIVTIRLVAKVAQRNAAVTTAE